MANDEKELAQAFQAIVDEEGGVRVDGQSFVLLYRQALADIQKEMETIMGRGAEGLLLHAGHKQGRALALRLASLVGSDIEAYRVGLRGYAARTGMFALEELVASDSVVSVRLRNSLIGRSYGKSDKPVCHYVRGFLLAIAEQMLVRTELACTELRCEAMGDASCAFEIRSALGGEARWRE